MHIQSESHNGKGNLKWKSSSQQIIAIMKDTGGRGGIIVKIKYPLSPIVFQGQQTKNNSSPYV